MKSKGFKSSSLFTGLPLLYYGVDMMMTAEGPGGSVLAVVLTLAGTAMVYKSLASLGDDGLPQRKRVDQKQNTTYIKSIEVGESFKPILTESELMRLKQVLDRDGTLQAIRDYRRLTGGSLLEAKTFIDKILAEEELSK